MSEVVERAASQVHVGDAVASPRGIRLGVVERVQAEPHATSFTLDTGAVVVVSTAHGLVNVIQSRPATVRRPCWCGAPATRMVARDGQASVTCDVHTGDFDSGTPITSVVEVADPDQWALLVTHVDDIRDLVLKPVTSVVPIPNNSAMGIDIAHSMAMGASADERVIDVVLITGRSHAHHFTGGQYAAMVDVVKS